MDGLNTVPTTHGSTDIPKAPKRKGGSLSKFIQDRHRRMSKMLGSVLTLGEPKAWGEFGFLASVHLTLIERGALAASVLRSMPYKDAMKTAEIALGASGGPLPAFLGGMDDARFWASCASRTELKAYALASFQAMSPQDQAAFFNHIRDVEIAA